MAASLDVQSTTSAADDDSGKTKDATNPTHKDTDMNLPKTQTDGPDSMIPHATEVCAHRRIISVLMELPDGKHSENWECSKCGKHFAPVDSRCDPNWKSVVESNTPESMHRADDDPAKIEAWWNQQLNETRMNPNQQPRDGSNARVCLEARIKELESKLLVAEAERDAFCEGTQDKVEEMYQKFIREVNKLEAKLAPALAEPLRWRRFSDEKPKDGQKILIRFDNPGDEHAYFEFDSMEGQWIGQWIPYPLDPEPLPKQEPDACDAAYMKHYGYKSLQELEPTYGAWRTAWAKAREQKL